MMTKIKELIFILTGKQPEPTESEKLLADIDEVVTSLSHCRRRFDLTTDSDLIDAAIYEELALRSRYAYLVKKARSQGITGRTALK